MLVCDAAQYHEDDEKMQPFGDSGERFVGLFEDSVVAVVVVVVVAAVVVVVIVDVMAFLAPAFPVILRIKPRKESCPKHQTVEK